MSQLIQYTSKELDLLARLMRAEAVGEGEYGMLMVGNVGVNRVLANCYTFRNINTITKMVFQNPGGLCQLVPTKRNIKKRRFNFLKIYIISFQ